MIIPTKGETPMNTQQTFTKDNIIVTDIEYDASASGDGVIFLHLEDGSIEIDVESYFGQTEYDNYCFVSNIVDDKFYYYYLDDSSIEAVNEYLIENNIKSKYMEEVSEAASQTF